MSISPGWRGFASGLIGRLRGAVSFVLLRLAPFPGSVKYWEWRYRAGGNSGEGSYGHLAEFKADVINRFVVENEIESVIEFGCGDGNQLSLAEYGAYIGYDVSEAAVQICRCRFKGDDRKALHLLKEYNGETAELALSLDVIYHLIEDAVYEDYMHRLFLSATRFVIIYSSNMDEEAKLESQHVRHRMFSRWVEANCKDWSLDKVVKNRFSISDNHSGTSFSDFYFFRKGSQV